MKLFLTSLLLLWCVTIRAESPMPAQGWEEKVIGGVHIVVPKECKTETQNKPGTGVVKKMTKLSFKTAAIDLELVFLEFPPGFSGNVDGAAANMGAQIKAALGEDAFTQWNAATISGRPARCLATKPSPTLIHPLIRRPTIFSLTRPFGCVC